MSIKIGQAEQNDKRCGYKKNDRGQPAIPVHELCIHRNLESARRFACHDRTYRMLPPSVFFFSKVMFIPSPFSSLHSTSNATGIPASSLFVPLTMLS